MDPLSLVFILGIMLFGVFALYFSWSGRKKSFNSAVFVTGVTIVSYIIMLEGSLTTFGPNEHPVFWTRWIAYALSCSLLMYVIGARVGATKHRLASMVGLTALVMITGGFAAVMTGPFVWLMFGVSSVFYVGLLSLIYHPDHRSKIGGVGKYIWFGWTLFPVVFILAPDGLGVVCALTASIAYLVLDFFTKIVFYLDLERGGKKAEKFEK